MSVIIEAEFNEIEDDTDELDLADGGSLPWLEADEDDPHAGGVDTAQMVGFIALLGAVLLVVVGLVWFVSYRDTGANAIADGSTIEAPEGPYKVRPEDAGGKQFAGTGDVAPVVGQGESPEARIAGAEAGDQDLGIAMPPISGDAPALNGGGAAAAASATSVPAAPATQAPSAAPSASGGVGVQLAAYSSRARADKGWGELQRKSKSLEGRRHRVVEGVVDNATVYRLQAVAATRAEADSLCAALKREGLDCQVKP